MGRKKRSRLFALGLLGCLTAHAGSPVWAIHGEHNTVYLAGSVHLLKANDSALPPAFDRAYAGSRALVMELDLGKLDPMEAAGWMVEHGTLPEGSDLRKAIGDERYRRVSAEAARLGLPMEVANQLAPWVLGLQLMELQYAQLGFDPQAGVEQQLERRAQSDGKPTSGLETMSEQLGVFERLSPEEQARFLDLIVTEMHEVGSETQSVVSAWRAGDAARLAALLGDEYKSFPVLYRTLVSDRNKRWVPQIEKLLKGPDNYFVVVGALHLVGDGGLLELMRRDGFKAEALQ
ncbi:MAG: hypothetical protein JWN85_4225 [Gammaproteobacteria bacterium]|nr:hypothetical protein [Gammaproteobacteria bacterium]